MRRPDLYSLPLRVRLALLARMTALKSRSPEAVARFAARHTRFYRRFYAGHDLDDFESLPVLRKSTVRDIEPYDLLADTHADRVRYYAETTGSSGSPTPAFFTPGEFRAVRFVAMSSPYLDGMRAALKDNRTCVNGLAFGFTVAGMSFGDVFAAMGGLVANVGSRSTLATPPRIARALGRLRPGAVAATPIDFLAWMRILREDHPERYDTTVESLRLLLSTAELCATSRVARIAEHFGLQHLDVYASVEGLFTLPCTCGRKHLLPAYHVELFDDDLARIGRTGTGRLAFTNRVKLSTPMVRYLLDDWVTVERCVCPHGFEYGIVPHGRYELNVELPCGIVNVEQLEDALFRHGLFGDYQVRLHDDRMELTVEQYDRPVPGGDIADAFEARFGVPARVTSVPFGELTDYRAPRGKKPILKLRDLRSTSTQHVPTYL